MKISVDRSKCLSAGQCLMAAPDFFDLDDEGLVMPLAETVTGPGEDDVRKAVDLCPARVITMK